MLQSTHLKICTKLSKNARRTYCTKAGTRYPNNLTSYNIFKTCCLLRHKYAHVCAIPIQGMSRLCQCRKRFQDGKSGDQESYCSFLIRRLLNLVYVRCGLDPSGYFSVQCSFFNLVLSLVLYVNFGINWFIGFFFVSGEKNE